MITPAAVSRLQRQLTLAYGAVWSLSVAALAGLALLISAQSLERELDEGLRLHAVAVYGLTWIDEDGFHQEDLDLETWLLEADLDIRIVQEDGTLLYSSPRLALSDLSAEIAAVTASEDLRYFDGADDRGVAYRMSGVPIYCVDSAPCGAVLVTGERSPVSAAWWGFAGLLLSACAVMIVLGLGLGAVLARRSLAPLVASMQERELLLAAAAHELRTPLASLTAIIESAQAGDEPADRALARLSDVVPVAAARVGRLLTWARLGTSGAAEHEPLRLDLLVEQVIDEDSPVILEAAACVVRGDATALAVAVRNMLENARRHGALPITVRVAEGSVAVEDAGEGLSAEHLAPFSARPGSPGSGLGLDIIRRIAQAHGGALLLGAGAHGGARVVLRLPPMKSPGAH